MQLQAAAGSVGEQEGVLGQVLQGCGLDGVLVDPLPGRRLAPAGAVAWEEEVDQFLEVPVPSVRLRPPERLSAPKSPPPCQPRFRLSLRESLVPYPSLLPWVLVWFPPRVAV